MHVEYRLYNDYQTATFASVNERKGYILTDTEQQVCVHDNEHLR